MIEITADTIAIWFMPISETSDYMAHVGQNDTEWKLTYRFRYYRGDQTKQFEESEDEKSWTTMTAPKEMCTQEAFEKRVEFALAELVKVSGQEPDVIRMGPGGVQEFAKELMARPWANTEQRTYH